MAKWSITKEDLYRKFLKNHKSYPTIASLYENFYKPLKEKNGDKTPKKPPKNFYDMCKGLIQKRKQSLDDLTTEELRIQFEEERKNSFLKGEKELNIQLERLDEVAKKFKIKDQMLENLLEKYRNDSKDLDLVELVEVTTMIANTLDRDMRTELKAIGDLYQMNRTNMGLPKSYSKLTDGPHSLKGKSVTDIYDEQRANKCDDSRMNGDDEIVTEIEENTKLK